VSGVRSRRPTSDAASWRSSLVLTAQGSSASVCTRDRTLVRALRSGGGVRSAMSETSHDDQDRGSSFSARVGSHCERADRARVRPSAAGRRRRGHRGPAARRSVLERMEGAAVFVVMLGRHQPRAVRRHERRRRALVAGIVSVVVETSGVWLRAGRLGGNVVVRCRSGHVYTTIWIPGASVKSLRLGWWRLQRCPVGEHWSIASPVRESDLPDRDKRMAREHRDIRIP